MPNRRVSSVLKTMVAVLLLVLHVKECPKCKNLAIYNDVEHIKLTQCEE